MGEAYLQCTYHEGRGIVFGRGGYVIVFKLSNKLDRYFEKRNECFQDIASNVGRCYIEKKDLVRELDRTKRIGLARVNICFSDMERLEVGIKNSGENVISRYFVPRRYVRFRI